MKRLYVAALIAAVVLSANAQTVTEGDWPLYKGTTIVKDAAGAQKRYPSQSLCLDAAKTEAQKDAKSVFACETRIAVKGGALVPQDCLPQVPTATDWTPVYPGKLETMGACAAGSSKREDIYNQTLLVSRAPANGGKACPTTSRQNKVSVDCPVVDVPPVVTNPNVPVGGTNQDGQGGWGTNGMVRVDRQYLGTVAKQTNASMILTKQAMQPLGANDIALVSDIGAWRTVCPFSHMNFDDSIVFPNQPGKSHLHTYYGNTQSNAVSTNATLLASPSTTCRGGPVSAGGGNSTSYWTPTPVDLKTGKAIVASYADIYYKSGYNNIPLKDVQWVPEGFVAVFGSSMAQMGPYPEFAPGYPRYRCEATQEQRETFFTCPAGSIMTMLLEPPNCWDGKNLDSPDHRSHLAHMTNNLVCPSTHPVAIVQVSYQVHWPIPVGSDPADWRLSSDMQGVDAGGRSGHGDYKAAWLKLWSDRALNECVRVRKDCGSHRFPDTGIGWGGGM